MSIPADSKPIDLPDSVVSELHTLYREGAADEPDAMLDRRILDAARSELHAAQMDKAKQAMPWWKTWARPMSTAALMILGLSLTWQVMDEQERAARDEFTSAESSPVRTDRMKPNELRNAPAATIQVPVKEQPTKDTVTSNSLPMAEKKQAISPLAAAVAEPHAFPARQDQAAADSGAIGSLAQPATVADTPAEVRQRQVVAQPAPPAPNVQMVPASTAPPSAMPRAEAFVDQANKSEARVSVRAAAKHAASPALAKEADAADDAATPEAWLDHIRKLHATGRTAEAAQSLERFRKRYPNMVLPDDLRGLSFR